MNSLLNKSTLVLNRNWQPVHVASVRRALQLAFADAARIVEPSSFQLFNWNEWLCRKVSDDEPAIRSVSFRVAIPEVISLTSFDRLPTVGVSFSKRNVLKRDRFTCQYCGIQPGQDALTIDHIHPRSRGGASSWENCVSACFDCNHRKADRHLDDVGMRLKHPPRQPTWTPWFSIGASTSRNWEAFLPRIQDNSAAG